MDLRRKLLWADCSAALAAGAAALLLHERLSAWYGLPEDFLLFSGGANVVYGSYSLFLASRNRRPAKLILLLVVANLLWAAACFAWAVSFRESASPFGLVHLVGEGLFVGALACFEWRWRDLLRTP